VIKLLQRNTHRASSIILTQRKELPYIFVFFVLTSILTLVIAWHGTSPISAFFIGEIIIGLFIIDFLRIKILMHLYQVILVYFYFSLVLFHSFNDISDEFYHIAYFVSVLHGLFFVVGYHLISPKEVVRSVAPKQNILSLVYFVFGLSLALLTLFDGSSNAYSYQFLSFEESQALPIFKMYISIIYSYIITIFLYLTSHPLIVTTFSFFGSLILYPMTGIKGPMVVALLSLFVVIQVYLYQISFKGLIVLGIFGASFVFFLIGSTSFRSDLSLQSLTDTLSNIEMLTDRWHYFIMASPESSHIRYTADIMRMIENGITDFRYGFDHFRFFLYPFKDLVSFWELSSYNQYPVLVTGRQVSAGLYLGLAGELFWNFGWFFPLLSLAYGVSLKWFTNYAFSGSYFWFVIYLLLFHSFLWHLYRGETNAITIVMTSLVAALIIMKLSFKVRQVRLIVLYITKFVVKR
jgi:hypothetical protein